MGLPLDTEGWEEGKGQDQGQIRELGQGQRMKVRG